jgi:flagellin
MTISSISSQTDYTALASGSRINSAADDSAGLAIANKLESESKGLSTGSSNAQAGQDLLKVADGALSSIQDSLQRIRELSVQASNNAIYSSGDIRSMQKEIDGLKQSIQDTAKGTSFNTMKLLDGSMADLNLATNPQGGGLKIQMVNSTLESLGIEDYDVTGKFSIKTIDDAIKKVSDARSSIGAKSNSLDHTVSANDYTSYLTDASRSKLEDTDYETEVTEQKKNEVLEQYRIFSLKAQQESESGILKLFQ